MRFILLLCLTQFSALNLGLCQTSSTANDTNVDVYILVDASGTMKSNLSEASSKIESYFETLEPNVRVSLTYFGSKNSRSDVPVTCSDKVELASPISPLDGIPSFPDLGTSESRTSIGNPLRAALEMGGDQAHIILITDGIEECNSDFVSLRQQFASASIDVLQVGAHPNSALNLLELKPQTNSQSPRLPTPLKVELVEPNPTDADGRPGYFLFIEAWSWLIGFILISINALVLGVKRANKSVQLERDIKEFERLREAVQNDQNGAAKDQLKNHIESVDEEVAEENKHYQFWRVAARYFLAGLALIALILLAILPPKLNLGGFDLSAAKKSAWTVLNSDFAAAFAVTWIALLFFYGSQSQRRRDALKDIKVATESTARFIEKKRFQEFETYKALQAAVRSCLTEFSKEKKHFIYADDNDVSADLSDDYDFVLRVMGRATISTNFEQSSKDEEDKNLAREIKNLRKLIDGSGLIFSQQADLPTFIDRLIETEKITTFKTDWQAYASNIRMGNREAIRSSLQGLAEKLRGISNVL